MRVIIMLLLTALSHTTESQTTKKKYEWISKKDIAPIGLQVLAGYSQGWREEVLYHPNALFRRYPDLNRSFWDSRQWKRWNANHLLKTITASAHTAAIVLHIGEKKNWKHYALDAFKYYSSYKLGFFISYNLQHKNKFTF